MLHPIFASYRRLLAFALTSLALGVVLAGLLSLTTQAIWTRALLFALPICLIYGFVALSSFFLCRSMTARGWPQMLALYAGAPLLSALAWLGLAVSWNGIGPLIGSRALVELSPAAWLIFFAAGLVFYLLALLAHEVLLAFERVRLAAESAVQARGLAREAELQMLRTQINPHFLFNCLNSISALTHIDPAAARDMAIELASFFRQTLTLAQRDRLALAEELALCEQYLAIEKRRFGEKLQTQWAIDPAALDCHVPSMSLQPLLENAIKHGIAPLAQAGTILVTAGLVGGQLKLEVSNPVDGDLPRPLGAGQGLGLRNLRARLAALHGAGAQIAWQRDASGFAVTVHLPVERDGLP